MIVQALVRGQLGAVADAKLMIVDGMLSLKLSYRQTIAIVEVSRTATVLDESTWTAESVGTRHERLLLWRGLGR